MINKKAYYDYFLIKKFNAGLILLGKEIKYIRKNIFNIYNSYCKLNYNNNRIYMYEFKINKIKKRKIQLLLSKKEIREIYQKIKNNNFTIIPTKIFYSNSGFAKVEIYIAQKKKKHQKIKISKKKEKLINEKKMKKYYF
ncbi:MAG: SsrA-binding protein [Candidatus Shikimatogenerans sp. JK-2022]|nr:SsrA-binding protein [Candidatus Shikimatogenerans bostrichidophilus]